MMGMSISSAAKLLIDKALTHERLKEMELQLKSNVNLEVKLISKTPSKKGPYSLNYKL